MTGFESSILIINNAEPEYSEFTEPFCKIAAESGSAYNCTVIQYKETLNTNFSNYDAIIMSGSPRGNDIVSHHLPYFQWLINCGVPVLGVCAGHHITGALYGAQLIRDREKEVGDFPVYIDRQDPIFTDYSSRFIARHNHHDSISLPNDFILLAHTDHCRVAVMKHVFKPIYTMQFHPEILNKKLVLNFLGLLSCRNSHKEV